MRKNKSIKVCIALAACGLFTACGEDRTHEYLAMTGAQHWIYETAETDYLYNEELTEPEMKTYFLAPNNFLQKIVSTKDSKNGTYFSHVDSVAVVSRASSTQLSFGFESTLLSGSNNAVRVLYTYPNSPATDAGIKRGDWIIAINGTAITSSLYNSALVRPRTAQQITLGTPNANGGYDTLKHVQLSAPRYVTENPIYKSNTFTVGTKKVAYLMYNSFTKDENTQLSQAVADIAAYAPDDMILDLRYNSGGYLSTAQLLATLIAPQNAANQTFLNLTSNTQLNRQEIIRFDRTGISVPQLNYNRLFVITSDYTASASEALIHGLKPYLGDRLIQVGTTTYGKNVAQTLYTNVQHPLLELWLTTSLISNSEGNSYANGLAPAYEISEDFSGSLSDDILGTATEQLVAPIAQYISSGSFPTTTTARRKYEKRLESISLTRQIPLLRR